MLEEAFAGGGVHLVNVPIDYSENKRVLVKELARTAARDIWRPEMPHAMKVYQAFDREP